MAQYRYRERVLLLGLQEKKSLVLLKISLRIQKIGKKSLRSVSVQGPRRYQIQGESTQAESVLHCSLR